MVKASRGDIDVAIASGRATVLKPQGRKRGDLAAPGWSGEV
jgi:hypothetical protein